MSTYNVFTIAEVVAAGIDPRSVQNAVGCCIERLSHGVYVLRRRCSVARHCRLRAFITERVLVLPPLPAGGTNPGIPPGTAQGQPDPLSELPRWQREKMEHIGRIAAYPFVENDVLSHHSAAVVWGLPLFHSSLDRVEMSNPRFKRTGKSYRRRHRRVPNSLILDGAGFDSRFGPRWPGAITPGDLGIAMTDVERTVLDITRDCTLSEAAMVLEAYLSGVLAPITNDHGAPEADRRTPVLGLDGRLSTFPLSQSEREARRARLLATATATDLGRRVPRLTRLLAISTGLSESPAEALANLGFHTLGLGVEQQAQICDSTGRIIAVADFLIRGTRCLLEVDGRKKYMDATGAADMARLEREKQRTDRIHAEGYHLLRCGWHEVTNPDIFGPLIWRGLRAARSLGRA